MNYERIDFSYNWNKKLHCDVFTTIRLLNPKKYEVGKKYRIFLKQLHIKDAEILEIKTFRLSDLNEFMAGIDTGYNRETCIQLIKKMYEAKVMHMDRQQFYFILLRTINKQTLFKS